MFVGLVAGRWPWEQGLAGLAPNWGEATNCSYSSPILPPSAPQKGVVHCKVELQLLVYRLL